MNDEQFQAWLDQHGGEVGRKDDEKEVDGPLNPATGLPSKVTTVDTTTVTARDGATITLRRNPGPYVGNTTVYSVTAQTPPKPPTVGTQRPSGATDNIEGTPLPDGTFDNERPVYVTRGPDGRVIDSKPLNPAQMDEWRQSRERSRNPGGKTDADLERERKEAEAKEKQDDTTVSDVSYSGIGKNRKKVTTYKSGRRVQEDAPTNATAIRTEYDPRTGRQTVTYDDGTTTTEEQKPTAADLEGPIPADAPKFTPDYNQDDLGLTEYNERLLQWANATSDPKRRQQGRRLLEQAGALATQTASHGTTLRSQAATARNQDITQRSQDLGETQSRRSFAGAGVDNAINTFVSGARHLGAGNGGLAARAVIDALNIRRAETERMGGFTDSPQVSPALASVRGAGMPPGVVESTQVTMQPGGNVEISPPGALPSSAAPAASAPPPAGPPARDDWRNQRAPWMPSTGDPNNPTNEINPNAVGMTRPAYLQGARQPAQWDPAPLMADLQSQGYAPDEIEEALAELQAEMVA